MMGVMMRYWAGPTIRRPGTALGGAGAGRGSETKAKGESECEVCGSRDRAGRAAPAVRAALGTGAPLGAAAGWIPKR